MKNSAVLKDKIKLLGLDKLLKDKSLSEIIINEPCRVITYGDEKKEWDIENLTYDSLYQLAQLMCIYHGLTGSLGEEMSIASVTLPDGERAQIAVPPATLNGVVSITIRSPSINRFTLDDYEKSGRFDNIKDATQAINAECYLTETDKRLLELKNSQKYAEFFRLAVKENKNIVLVGGTGSGKTTLMKAMCDEYPTERRIITIEDVHELSLPKHDNKVHLFYRKGGLSPKDIIEGCMRMKPDHILLAELRGDETWSYFEALNTGHRGSITTVHANDCKSGLARIVDLIKQSPIGQSLELSHIEKTVKASIDVLIFCKDTKPTEIYYNQH